MNMKLITSGLIAIMLLVGLASVVPTPTQAAPYITINPVSSVGVGEPLYIGGVTNLPDGFAIVITCKGPVELIPQIVYVENGAFNAAFDTTDALVGAYRVKADDGDGNTDEVIVDILTAVPATPTPIPQAPNAALVIEDARVGNTAIILIHHGGDTIVDAFTSGVSGWNNLIVKYNGADVVWSGNVILGGDSDNNFASGEQLKIIVPALASGDIISVVYVPLGVLMQRVKVAPMSIPTPTVPPVIATPTPIPYYYPTPTVPPVIATPTPIPYYYPTPTPIVTPTVKPTPTPTKAPIGKPQLTISQTTLREEPEVGEDVLITVTISNAGNGIVKNINLREHIPSSVSINFVDGANSAGNLITWSGDLYVGQTYSIMHSFRILEERNRAVPVKVTYEDESGKRYETSATIYISAKADRQTEEIPAPTPLIRGFEAVFAIAGLLAVAYLIRIIRRSP